MKKTAHAASGKPVLFVPRLAGSALAAVLAFGTMTGPAYADKDVGKSVLTFTSVPVAEKVGAGEHRIYPYRNEDRLIVVVIDPIVCGQKPANARFEIQGTRVSLRYDLSPAPAGVYTPSCTAHSTFDITNVPHGDLVVEFAGGIEPFHSAQMKRCPNTEPQVDVWDCMVPQK